MNHETKEIIINNDVIPVDKEMADVIITLNKLGYKTSGCCIGNEGNNSAWIIIQEINEDKMINLMKKLDNCCYQLTKQLYKKKSDNIIYVQYKLETPEGNIPNRILWVNQWANILEWCDIATQCYTDYKTQNQIINYNTVDKLFQ